MCFRRKLPRAVAGTSRCRILHKDESWQKKDRNRSQYTSKKRNEWRNQVGILSVHYHSVISYHTGCSILAFRIPQKEIWHWQEKQERIKYIPRYYPSSFLWPSDWGGMQRCSIAKLHFSAFFYHPEQQQFPWGGLLGEGAYLLHGPPVNRDGKREGKTLRPRSLPF